MSKRLTCEKDGIYQTTGDIGAVTGLRLQEVEGNILSRKYHKIEVIEPGKARCKIGARVEIERWQPDLREVFSWEDTPELIEGYV